MYLTQVCLLWRYPRKRKRVVTSRHEHSRNLRVTMFMEISNICINVGICEREEEKEKRNVKQLLLYNVCGKNT